MNHALVYILCLALNGAQLTPLRAAFDCPVTGQTNQMRCCCQAQADDRAADGGDAAPRSCHASHEKMPPACHEQDAGVDPPSVVDAPMVQSDCCGIHARGSAVLAVNETSGSKPRIACFDHGPSPAIATPGAATDPIVCARIAGDRGDRDRPPGIQPARYILHGTFLI